MATYPVSERQEPIGFCVRIAQADIETAADIIQLPEDVLALDVNCTVLTAGDDTTTDTVTIKVKDSAGSDLATLESTADNGGTAGAIAMDAQYVGDGAGLGSINVGYVGGTADGTALEILLFGTYFREGRSTSVQD